jgi:hypothetical protein
VAGADGGKTELVEPIRKELGGAGGRQRVLNVGVTPLIEVPPLLEDIGPRARIPHTWEITGPEADGSVEYFALDVVEDSTAGLTRSGIVRLVLPPAASIGAPANDVRRALAAGVGDRPPRLDDLARADRIVCWLRLRPTQVLQSLPLSWAGINAVEIDQRETIEGRVGNERRLRRSGVALGSGSVEPERSTSRWRRPAAACSRGCGSRSRLASRDDAVSPRQRGGHRRRRWRAAHPEADARRHRRHADWRRTAGNLPAGTPPQVAARDLAATRSAQVVQPLPTSGGDDAETIEAAERRIPARLRHRERAVTADDTGSAAETPGVRMGRSRCSRIQAAAAAQSVPGVVSVLVLPLRRASAANPRPISRSSSRSCYLDGRRPIATELY